MGGRRLGLVCRRAARAGIGRGLEARLRRLQRGLSVLHVHELVAKARFMFGKQIMSPEEADSPARRIYFAIQTAYVGENDERSGGLATVHELIAAFKAATTSELAREILDIHRKIECHPIEIDRLRLK